MSSIVDLYPQLRRASHRELSPWRPGPWAGHLCPPWGCEGPPEPIGIRGHARVVLSGLGDGSSNICLDQSQNTVPCTSPDCTYGDCGATGPQVTTGPLCLDQDENAVACADPNCTYGDCISAGKSAPAHGAVITAATSLPTVSRPSPVLQVPLSAPGGFGLFMSSSTLISGLPNWGVLVGGAVGLALLASVAGGSRRRR